MAGQTKVSISKRAKLLLKLLTTRENRTAKAEEIIEKALEAYYWKLLNKNYKRVVRSLKGVNIKKQRMSDEAKKRIAKRLTEDKPNWYKEKLDSLKNDVGSTGTATIHHPNR